MKQIFKLIAALLIFPMVMIPGVCTTVRGDQVQETSVSIDFSDEDPFRGAIFKATNDGWTVKDGALSNHNQKAVYALECACKIAEDGIRTLDLDIKSPFPAGDMSAWMTTYIGLRLASQSSNPTGSSGLWIAVRGNRLGVRTNTWPETLEWTISEDFTDFNHLRIVDDQDANLVCIYGGQNDTLLARIRLEDTGFSLYKGDESSPFATPKLPYSITKGGYVTVWVHNIPNVALKKMQLNYNETVKDPYIPADTSKLRDNYSDTWVACDDEGREMPSFVEVGAPDGDKLVGMFYFLWHDHTQGALYDHTKAYEEGGVQGVWDIIPQGPLGYAHYWAQPYFGYYRSDDEWVIRKHATMLVNAGVDFIFFDCSNNLLYPHITSTIFKVYHEMRLEGQKTPDFMYFLGDQASFAANLVPQLYNDIYKTGEYSDMWVMMDGKPLILGNFSQITDETLLNAFTVRRSWAFESGEAYQSTRGRGTWLWADTYPQAPGKSLSGKVEQMVVMSGFWANGNGGRSNVSTASYTSTGKFRATDPQTFDDFGFGLYESGISGKGLAYQEHWNYALKRDVPLVMITGWNEWWAGRWGNSGSGNPAQGQTIANTYVVDSTDQVKSNYYVDAFNPEFSRDIEPMSGGFGDNYYYQTIMNIRRYKGVRPIPENYAEGDVNGLVGWDKVYPEYRDTLGDIAHRNKIASCGDAVYINETGRNDFDYAKVAFRGDQVLFYVRTREDIILADGENWMNLFINTDKDYSTGWYGYDLVINRARADGKVSIEGCVDNSWSWEKIGEADYILQGNEMVITLPLSVLGGSESFDFKWADNSTTSGNIMEFMDLGDTAPDDRFNYRVIRAAVAEETQPETGASDTVDETTTADAATDAPDTKGEEATQVETTASGGTETQVATGGKGGCTSSALCIPAAVAVAGAWALTGKKRKQRDK